MSNPSSLLLDEQERRKWQNPEEVLAEIRLLPGMTFLDIGCGQGFFTIPAAITVDKSGKIYALDINRSNIEILQEKVVSAGLTNVILEVGKAEDLILCKACADIVFFSIVLHDFANPGKVISNARAMIKQSGKLIDLDWKKEPMTFGPPLHIRFDEEKAKHLIESNGFNVQSIEKSGRYHYIITAVPQ